MSALAALLGNVWNGNVAVELGGGLNFGSGLQAVYNTTTKRIDVTATGGGGGGTGGHTIEDEGTPVTARGTLNFVGVNVNVSDIGGKTTVTISGPTVSYVDAGDTATLAAAAALIPLAGGSPVDLNLAGSAASAGSDPDYARQDHNHAITGRLPFANFVAATAADKVIGSTGAGSFLELTLGEGVERSGSTVRISSQLPARGSENVVVDVYPPTQTQGTLATAASANVDVALSTGKIYELQARVAVNDGAGGTVLYKKTLHIGAENMGGTAAVLTNDMSGDMATAGWSFTATGSGANIRFTLANTSGTTRSYNVIISAEIRDKP